MYVAVISFNDVLKYDLKFKKMRQCIVIKKQERISEATSDRSHIHTTTQAAE